MYKRIGKSNIGKNETNEDFILINDEIGLYVITDGVGGLQYGSIASRLACTIIEEEIINKNPLKHAIRKAHLAIINYTNHYFHEEAMATTIAAVLIKDGRYDKCWAGSSRVYFWNKGLLLLTKDDTYAELLQLNDININKNKNKNKNSKLTRYQKMITQALGMKKKHLFVHSNHGFLEQNQFLILTTDGFHQNIKPHVINTIFNKFQGIESINNSLLKATEEAEITDDFSYILIKGKKSAYNFTETIQANIVRKFPLPV